MPMLQFFNLYKKGIKLHSPLEKNIILLVGLVSWPYPGKLKKIRIVILRSKLIGKEKDLYHSTF